jgi:hypothetical protein
MSETNGSGKDNNATSSEKFKNKIMNLIKGIRKALRNSIKYGKTEYTINENYIVDDFNE